MITGLALACLAQPSPAQEAFQRAPQVQHASAGPYALTFTSSYLNDLGEPFNQKLVIERGGDEVASFKGYTVTPTDASGATGELSTLLRDATGDATPELFVATYSGGRDCCWGLHVLSLGDPLAHRLDIDASNRRILLNDLDHDGLPEVVRYDPVFDDYWSGVGASPAGAVVLSRKGSQPYAADPALTATYNRGIVATPPRDSAIETTLQRMIDLVYAGRGGDAEALLRSAWPTLPHGTALSLYDRPDPMIAAMWCRLGKSDYATAVFALNRRPLPTDCAAPAKAPYLQWLSAQKDKKR